MTDKKDEFVRRVLDIFRKKEQAIEHLKQAVQQMKGAESNLHKDYEKQAVQDIRDDLETELCDLTSFMAPDNQYSKEE